MKILKVIICFIFIILTSPIKFGFAENKYLSQCIEQADVGDKMKGKTYDQVETATAENICLKAYSVDKENIKIIRSLGRIYHKKKFKKSLSFQKL